MVPRRGPHAENRERSHARCFDGFTHRAGAEPFILHTGLAAAPSIAEQAGPKLERVLEAYARRVRDDRRRRGSWAVRAVRHALRIVGCPPGQLYQSAHVPKCTPASLRCRETTVNSSRACSRRERRGGPPHFLDHLHAPLRFQRVSAVARYRVDRRVTRCVCLAPGTLGRVARVLRDGASLLGQAPELLPSAPERFGRIAVFFGEPPVFLGALAAVFGLLPGALGRLAMLLRRDGFVGHC